MSVCANFVHPRAVALSPDCCGRRDYPVLPRFFIETIKLFVVSHLFRTRLTAMIFAGMSCFYLRGNCVGEIKDEIFLRFVFSVSFLHIFRKPLILVSKSIPVLTTGSV